MKRLFSHKSRTLENIPSTQAAPKKHIKQTCIQASLWNQSLVLDPKIPGPSDWGWTKESTEWQPFWTAPPEEAKSCHELIRCNCRKGFTGWCTCVKAALTVTVHISVFVRETVLGFSHSRPRVHGIARVSGCRGKQVHETVSRTFANENFNERLAGLFAVD